MSSLQSLTKKQWIILLTLLAVNLVCVYGGLFPLESVTHFLGCATIKAWNEKLIRVM